MEAYRSFTLRFLLSSKIILATLHSMLVIIPTPPLNVTILPLPIFHFTNVFRNLTVALLNLYSSSYVPKPSNCVARSILEPNMLAQFHLEFRRAA